MSPFFPRHGKVSAGRRVRGDPGAAPRRTAAREDPRAFRGGRPEDGKAAAGRQGLRAGPALRMGGQVCGK